MDAKEILTERQLSKFKSSTLCLVDDCNKSTANYMDLCCEDHQVEGGYLKDYQKCAIDGCYELVAFMKGVKVVCNVCRGFEPEATEDKPIEQVEYNKSKCGELAEVLARITEINKIHINNIILLKTSYNPKDGSMLLNIKIN